MDPLILVRACGDFRGRSDRLPAGHVPGQGQGSCVWWRHRRSCNAIRRPGQYRYRDVRHLARLLHLGEVIEVKSRVSSRKLHAIWSGPTECARGGPDVGPEQHLETAYAAENRLLRQKSVGRKTPAVAMDARVYSPDAATRIWHCVYTMLTIGDRRSART